MYHLGIRCVSDVSLLPLIAPAFVYKPLVRRWSFLILLFLFTSSFFSFFSSVCEFVANSANSATVPTTLHNISHHYTFAHINHFSTSILSLLLLYDSPLLYIPVISAYFHVLQLGPSLYTQYLALLPNLLLYAHYPPLSSSRSTQLSLLCYQVQ